jgi:glycosyltransferase-like protein
LGAEKAAVTSVGIFTYSTKPRGSVVHAACLAEALVDAGHHATVYALGKEGTSFYRPLRCPSRLFPAREAPGDPEALVRQRVGEFAAGMAAIAADVGAHDVWHAEDCLAASALLDVRGPASPAIVRTVHHVERFENPYLASCQRRSILAADRVLAVSRLTRRDVAREFGRDASLVPNGVDAGRFAGPPSRDRRWLRERFGASPDDAVVLSVGGVEPRKNTLRALAAVRGAALVHPNLRWIVVGGSSLWDHSAYSARFESELALAGADLRSRIVRAGAVDDAELTALYRLSDVLFCPSEQEGFGLCVLEAMAAGLPVVVPEGAPFDEYLDDRSAMRVDPRSPEHMAAALTSLIADRELRGRLANAARTIAEAFSWRRSAQIHAGLYASLRHAGTTPLER